MEEERRKSQQDSLSSSIKDSDDPVDVTQSEYFNHAINNNYT